MRRVDPGVSSRQMNDLLSDNRNQLTLPSMEDNIRVTDDQSTPFLTIKELKDTKGLPMERQAKHHRSRPLCLRAVAIVFFGCVLVGLLTLVLYYHTHSADTSFERFMDGQGVGVRAMMTGVGVLIKAYWQLVGRGE